VNKKTRRDNVPWFHHPTDSYSSGPFRRLREQFGWTGEGKYWALVSIIGQADNGQLKIMDPLHRRYVFSQLGYEEEEFTEFLKWIVKHDLVMLSPLGILTSNEVNKEIEHRKRRTEKNKIAYSARKPESQNPPLVPQPPKEADIKEVTSMMKSGIAEPFTEGVQKTSKEICEFFGFSEIKNFRSFADSMMFANVLETTGRLEDFNEQFEAYKAFKAQSNSPVHGFKKFIGTIEEKFEDGAWASENWIHKIKNYVAFKSTKSGSVDRYNVGTKDYKADRL
jgi:hypothetical protein